jgi:hypothetical protein
MFQARAIRQGHNGSDCIAINVLRGVLRIISGRRLLWLSIT